MAVGGDGGYGGEDRESWEEGREDGHFGSVGEVEIVISDNSRRDDRTSRSSNLYYFTRCKCTVNKHKSMTSKEVLRRKVLLATY